MIKVTNGKIFGGYADMSWRSSGGSHLGKGNSFLFILKNDTFKKCICTDSSVEIDCTKRHLMTFG